MSSEVRDPDAPADGAVPGRLARDGEDVDLALREGRFQRWLSLVAALSSALSGLEVAYEHYKGSYGGKIMYTPVILSGALFVAGVAGFADKRAAKSVLPAVSLVTLADALTGFVFHVRGIERKPGGWRLPVTNIVMGPPLFAPLLFGISAYLGVVASRLRREDDGEGPALPRPSHPGHWAHAVTGEHEPISDEQAAREAGIQAHLALAAALSASLSGFEALYSHYKNNFTYRVQWSPILLTPALMTAGIGAIVSRRVAQTWLPIVSLVALADGLVGFFYHARGGLRRPGALRRPLYTLAYGPPVFAPLLFAASGMLGLMASLMRRGD